MDMVAGHFAHMEFVTSSELSFPFTREVAALARQTVMGAMERNSANSSDPPVLLNDFSNETDADPFEDVILPKPVPDSSYHKIH
jgi:hypothetical protein